MEITQTPALEAHQELSALVKEKDGLLRDEVGTSSRTAAATWDVEADEQGRPLVTLRLREPWGSSEGRFAPPELGDNGGLTRRLRDMTGQLVRAGARARVEGWLASLEKLYADMQAWTREVGPDVTVGRGEMTLHERLGGEYKAPTLVLTYRGRQMVVRPVARWVVGAEGRVDVTGSDGPYTLLYLPDRGGWYWLDDNPIGRLHPLTGDLFRRMAEACLR